MSAMDKSPEEQAAIEFNLRSMHWKALVKSLKQLVERKHQPLELPPMVRRWLEVNRAAPKTAEEVAHVEREVRAIDWWIAAGADSTRWFADHVEYVPISGWIITATHFLKDDRRWWLFTGQRHDDAAPLVGAVVPAPASKVDRKKLDKIISYAGGNPKRELLRTGAVTQEEHDELIASGNPDVAGYGQIFFWWRA